MLRSIGLPELLVILAVFVLVVPFTIWPVWRVVSKAGYPGVVGLLAFVPVFGFFLLLFMAFSKWPIERELEELRVRTPQG